MRASMFLELLTRVLRERQQEPQLFQAAMQVLEALEEGDALQPALRLFELELLDQLGYGIDFSAAGKPLNADAFYRFLSRGSDFVGSALTMDQCESLAGNRCWLLRAEILVIRQRWMQRRG